MPILGADLPLSLVETTRIALLEGVLTSETVKDIVGHEVHLWVKRKAYTGDYEVKGQTREDGFFTIAKFGMLPMPGCKGLCIFHHVSVEPKFQGKGLGQELLRIRLDAARTAGYSGALATVQRDNGKELQILAKAGWTPLQNFKNKRTGNDVFLMFKPI